jgi:hypothetical protein
LICLYKYFPSICWFDPWFDQAQAFVKVLENTKFGDFVFS